MKGIASLHIATGFKCMIIHFNFSIYLLPLIIESDDEFADMDAAMLENNISGVWVRREIEGIVEVCIKMGGGEDSAIGILKDEKNILTLKLYNRTRKLLSSSTSIPILKALPLLRYCHS